MPALPIRFLGASTVCAVLACATPAADRAWPEPRPMGAEIETFRPPARAPEPVDVPATVTAPAAPCSLDQALTLALQHNPELRSRAWSVRIDEAEARQADLLPNPELEVEVEDFGGQRDLQGIDGAEATLRLSQRIETWGKQGKRAEAAAQQAALSGWDYEAGRLDLITETRQRFFATLAAQERLALSEGALTLARQAHATVAERAAAGAVAPLEETRAGIALELVHLEHEQDHLTLEQARHHLAALWGSSEPRFTVVEGPFYALVAPRPLPELVQYLLQSPELARWSTERARGQAELERAEADAIPDVDVSAGAKWVQEAGSSAFLVGLAVPVPLFDRQQGSVEAARVALARTEEQRRAAEIDTRMALGERHRRLSMAQRSATVLRDKVLPAAEVAFAAAKEGFSAGKFNFIEVLDAQRTLFEVRARYVDALSAYHSAHAEVERLVGEMPEGDSGSTADPTEVRHD